MQLLLLLLLLLVLLLLLLGVMAVVAEAELGVVMLRRPGERLRCHSMSCHINPIQRFDAAVRRVVTLRLILRAPLTLKVVAVMMMMVTKRLLPLQV